jgi:hypothetical protein
MMHDGNRFTRLSKVLAVVLLGLFLVTFFAPSSKEYLTLVPGRCVSAAAVAGCMPILLQCQHQLCSVSAVQNTGADQLVW